MFYLATHYYDQEACDQAKRIEDVSVFVSSDRPHELDPSTNVTENVMMMQ